MRETVATVAKKIDALSTAVDQGFAQVDQRFSAVDQRFSGVDQRFSGVDQRFEAIDQRFAEVDQRFLDLQRSLSERIREEGEKTRRHFDIVAEGMKAERNLALDKSMATGEQLARLTASNAADHVAFDQRLSDHEQRLGRLEKSQH